MELRDIGIIVFVVLNIISWVYKNAGPKEDEPARPRPGRRLPDAPEAGKPSIQRIRELLGQTSGRVKGLLERCAALESQLGIGSGPVRVLRSVLRDRVAPDLNASLSRLTEAERGLSQGSLSQGGLGEVIAVLRAELNLCALADLRVAVLETLARRRQDPDLAPGIADADALADALLGPIRDFANIHGLKWKAQRPICVPADPGTESVWFGLLPDGWPIIFVPDDLEEDLYRRASVAHEVAHVIWRSIPGLADEIVAATGADVSTDLPRLVNGRVMGTLDNAFSAWIEEIHADAMTVILLGPAGLRGLIHALSGGQADLAYGTKDGRYAEHPPVALRVGLAASLLAEMGFEQELKPILADYGPLPEQILLPLADGRRLRVATELLLDRGREILVTWYRTEWRALSGHAFHVIPGLEMSPGMWARARRRAEDLRAGLPFNDDARTVLAAAIEARALYPNFAPRIAAGMRRAILGLDADERRAPDRHYQQASFEDPISLAEIRDALVLGMLLAPVQRSGRRRPPALPG